MTNVLYYGDNLDILRHSVGSESVDLVYLDPPFNSKRDYNVLFKEKSGEASPAQIEAFTDTWAWDRAGTLPTSTPPATAWDRVRSASKRSASYASSSVTFARLGSS